MADAPVWFVRDCATGTLREEPFSAADVAALAQQQADGVEMRRGELRDELVAALAATDFWLARALEDGVELDAGRRQYRADLRDALAEVASAADPDAVVLPTEPPVPARFTAGSQPS